MKPATANKIAQVRGALEAKYLGYLKFEPEARVLLCMAYLCDSIKVHEVGNNRGEWVEAFLDSAGVAGGNPWCASALTFACRVAVVSCPRGPAAVRNWHEWFSAGGKLSQIPKRGMIAMHNSGGGKGHIGIVVKSIGPIVWTIEGNTSSGESGSQRDGDGLYRRTRFKGYWSWGFGELAA